MATALRARSGVVQVLATVALILLLASTWIVVKVSLDGAPVSAVSAGRTLFSTLGLGAVLVCSRLRQKDEAVGVLEVREAAPRIVVLALLGVVAYSAFSTLAIESLGPNLPSLVLSLSPLVVLVLQSFLKKAVPSGKVILGTSVAVLGAWVFAAQREVTSLNVVGIVYALAAMISISLYGVCYEKFNVNSTAPLHAQLIPIYAVGGIPLLLWTAVDLGAGGMVTGRSVALLAVLGIVVYVPAYLIQHYLILTHGAQYAALVGLAVSPAVLTSSWALNLGPSPISTQLFGVTLVVLGMAVVVSRQ